MAEAGKDEGEQIREALRVSQLDAAELDSELFELLKGKLESAFKYIKPDLTVRYGAELNAVLRFVLWKYTINALDATVGQKLLELRYKNVQHTQGGSTVWMSSRQKWLYAVCVIGGQWLQERKDDVSLLVRNRTHGDKLCKIIDWMVGGWKVAALLNFLIFLTRGHYLFLMERILGIRTVYPRLQGVRQIGFEYMDRELLWHGFAEFLFFILPLINFNKIKNFFIRHMLLSTKLRSLNTRTDKDYEECAICGLWPYNPREIGCRHVFCYYCIQSNYLADAAYVCPRCGHDIPSAEHIKTVQVRKTQDES